jgi:salicylate hydroxylase
VALLGDAAHAMTPFLGQGAAAAIEDALVLARAFEAASSVPEALARYEAARKERCGFIQVESNLNADRLEGDEAHLYGMTQIKNEETLGLFAYDAGTVEV